MFRQMRVNLTRSVLSSILMPLLVNKPPKTLLKVLHRVSQPASLINTILMTRHRFKDSHYPLVSSYLKLLLNYFRIEDCVTKKQLNLN